MKKIILLIISFSFCLPACAFAAEASLRLISGAGVYLPKKDFTVRLIVNSGGGVGINAAGAALKFNPKDLSVKKITKVSSIFKYWPVDAKYSNKEGYIAIAGGSPGANKDSAGRIIDITFTPLRYAKTYVEFSTNKLLATSSVLTADSYATNILKYPWKAVYIIGNSTAVAEANSLVRKMSGQILLEVQKNGEAWYIYPNDLKRYYLGRPTDAFAIMRKLGLGVKHSYISAYKNKTFPKTVAGKILLDVEDSGKAYYIDPSNKIGYYLGRPSDAFKVMRERGLGIANNDIDKIPDWAI